MAENLIKASFKVFGFDPDKLCAGQIALMGDAAFVARQQIGLDVTNAAEDSDASADAIMDHGASSDALLCMHCSAELNCLSVVQRARLLGGYTKVFGAKHHPVEIRQLLAMHETTLNWGRYRHHSVF